MSDPRMFYPMQPIVPGTTNPVSNRPTPVKNTNANTASLPFADVLKKELGQVKFSQHALQRLETRQIKLDESQMSRLENAVDKAAQKGARESLVLMDNQLAFVVSVRNRTVITAMDGASIKDNIFTNIDSAIMI